MTSTKLKNDAEQLLYAHRIKSVAKILNCSIPTVYRAVNRGELAIVKVGGVSLIRDSDIRRLLGMPQGIAA